MASNNMINLKVFLRDENISEARRFTVDASVVTSFLFMKEKLQTVFPVLRERDFKITWKDMDGDEITIASDEDFITAFTEMNGHVKVLYVTVGKGNREPIFIIDGEAQDTSYHGPRVICDVCNQMISGFRYKCVQCPDYDLCAGCEHQGHHAEHLMIRVPNNESYMPKCARKFMHHFARNLKKSAYTASKEAYKAARYASKCAAATASAAASATATNANDEERTAQPEPGNSNQNTDGRPQGCPFSAGEGINMNDFHALGAMARQHLGPLFDALQTPPQNANNTNQPDQGLFFDIIRNAVDGFFGKVPENNTTNQQQPSQNQTDKENIPTKDTTQNSETNTTPMDVENATRDKPEVTASSAPPQPENEQRRDPGWTFVATNQLQSNQNANENIQNLPGFVYHENPKIAEGLVQLYEMGFSNENGILTRLLERFEGNVSQVVKALVDMKL